MKKGPLIERLRQRMDKIVNEFSALVGELPIRHMNRVSPGVVIIAPEYYFEEPSDQQRAVQMRVKRDYEAIVELLNLMLRKAPEDLIAQMKDSDKQFRVWLELGHNWGVKCDPKQNAAGVKSAAHEFEKIFSVLEKSADLKTILVPDTNSLIVQPDPVQYREIAEAQSFVFMLLPTVLGELDRLQREHRNPELRDKAKKIITRIKGWRNQGALSDGVKVDGSIMVQASHREPDMKHSLSWFDESVFDDRILANVLELFSEYPSSRVVLVTGDINLQNKADAALIETAEISE